MILKFFNKIFVQNGFSKELLNAKGISNVIESGDLRFDRVSQTVSFAKKIQVAEMFKGESKVLVCGSTWSEDEKIIADRALSLLQTADLKLIIAPHEITEPHIQKIISLFPNSLRYSEISKEPVSSALSKLKKASVLIIDNIGMLASLYQYADIAYIGGGFGAGIHNILEAVAFGVPVIFGPNHYKFPEANELAEQGGGFIISDANGFSKAVNFLLSDERIRMMASLVCKNFVQQRRGASEKILGNLTIGFGKNDR
jgi:3-deoxy-D-manno-octulosonic-acid transferase